MRSIFREAQQAYRSALKRAEAFRKQGMKPDDPAKVANNYRNLVDELFELRVLDPAMGSGHFLVEAVDFICDRILGQKEGFLQAFPWNPVTAFLQETRQAILADMERQGVTIDASRLTDINLLKRHILKRCIYGVDLNPMAVELAKVSLWLDCFTLGAPLSFLNHL
jgi:type II restriction/modification system DNA methylase subunit YeeA